MKKLSITMMMTLLSVLASLPALAGRAVPSTTQTDSATTAPRRPGFQVGMYQSIRSQILNVLVEKDLGCRVRVRLLNKGGEVLYEELLTKRQQKYWLKLNFADVPDGTYTVVVTNESEQITKLVKLSSQVLYQMPSRALLVMN
ncbi:hypothetical protein [Telluribacter sp. SYSU D00476]|uniref:hypothetical protein n=1 Tax=Telluribacter sp. SYSU D00476 TaxID=2811430 RepID=UPI001FF26EB9|nr:hypothetical protein [Telluribacter sp. SYSU D00476]